MVSMSARPGGTKAASECIQKPDGTTKGLSQGLVHLLAVRKDLAL